jgi:hypothetical protein
LACWSTRASGGSKVGVGVIDGVREGRGVSVGGPEGVGVSLAVAVGDAVGVGLAVGCGVADAAGNSVAVWVAVGVGVPVAAEDGRPARARPPTKPIASAIAPVGPAMSRVRFTAPIYSRRAFLTRVPRSGVPWGRIARRSSGRWPVADLQEPGSAERHYSFNHNSPPQQGSTWRTWTPGIR